jgi:DNA-directed RNA polymerase specialized sigma24 family protein
VVRNECIDWWRAAQQAPTPSGQLELVAAPTAASMEQVAANQRRLLDALDPDERRLFATWALQKHLPQGTLDAAGAAARLGLDVRSYNNAKRRLRDKIRRLAAAWGLAPRAFFSVADDEGPRRTGARHVG